MPAFLTVFLVLPVGPIPLTKSQPLPLDQLAATSGLIVFGEVTGVKRLDAEKDEITIRVARLLKGDYAHKSFTVVLVCRVAPERAWNGRDPVVQAGDRGVFFLKQIRDGQGELARRGSLSLFPKAGLVPAADAKVLPPAVRFTGRASKHGRPYLIFEVSNPTDVPINYLGYRSDSFEGGLPEGTIAPQYDVEVRTGKEWKDHGPNWACGFGLGLLDIQPKSKVKFDVPLPGGAWDTVRVSFMWWCLSSGNKVRATSYSEEISRKDAEGK
jgi:hypothetical protein